AGTEARLGAGLNRHVGRGEHEGRRSVPPAAGGGYTKQSGNELTGLAQGLIAYNMGPGKTDKWLAAGADPAKLPKETRDYVTKVFSKLGLPGMTAARGSSGIMGASAEPKLPKVK